MSGFATYYLDHVFSRRIQALPSSHRVGVQRLRKGHHSIGLHPPKTALRAPEGLVGVGVRRIQHPRDLQRLQRRGDRRQLVGLQDRLPERDGDPRDGLHNRVATRATLRI